MKEGGGDKDVEILRVGKRKEGFYFFLLSDCAIESTCCGGRIRGTRGKTQAQDTPCLLIAWDRYDAESKSAYNSSKWEPFISLMLYKS